MKLSMKAVPLALTVALAGPLTAPAAFGAFQDQLTATTIPASMCHPRTETDAAKVYLSGGQWYFRSGETGTAQFYCPLPLSHRDKDGEQLHLWSYEPHYRDSDGKGTDASVMVRPTWRKGASYYVGPAFLSNNYSAAGYNTVNVELDRELEYNAIYSFLVSIRRTSTSQYPSFAGIKFPNFHYAWIAG